MSEPSNSASSKRARTSPDNTNQTAKRVSVNKDVKMELFQSPLFVQSIKDIMNEIFDVKLAPIATQASLDSLNAELVALKEENVELKKELSSLKLDHECRLEEVEIQSRKNNLIFRGLQYHHSEAREEVVSKFCRETLSVDINPTFLHAFSLGKSDVPNKPILASFCLTKDKSNIMGSLKKLKDTGYTVHQDLPLEVRKKRTKLLLLRKEVTRLCPRVGVRVGPNTISVDGHKFSWNANTGLLSNMEPGLEKLCKLIGADLSTFHHNLLKDIKDLSQAPGPQSQPGEGRRAVVQHIPKNSSPSGAKST